MKINTNFKILQENSGKIPVLRIYGWKFFTKVFGKYGVHTISYKFPSLVFLKLKGTRNFNLLTAFNITKILNYDIRQCSIPARNVPGEQGQTADRHLHKNMLPSMNHIQQPDLKLIMKTPTGKRDYSTQLISSSLQKKEGSFPGEPLGPRSTSSILKPQTELPATETSGTEPPAIEPPGTGKDLRSPGTTKSTREQESPEPGEIVHHIKTSGLSKPETEPPGKVRKITATHIVDSHYRQESPLTDRIFRQMKSGKQPEDENYSSESFDTKIPTIQETQDDKFPTLEHVPLMEEKKIPSVKGILERINPPGDQRILGIDTSSPAIQMRNIFSNEKNGAFYDQISKKYLRMQSEETSSTSLLNKQNANIHIKESNIDIPLEIVFPQRGIDFQHAKIGRDSIFSDRNDPGIDITKRISDLVLRKPDMVDVFNIKSDIDRSYRNKEFSPIMAEKPAKRVIPKNDEMNRIADRVYKILETRLLVEKERRGLS